MTTTTLEMSSQPEHQQQQPLEQQQDVNVVDDDDADAVLLTVSHEGRSCQVTVHQGETILAALERQAALLRRHLTGLPLDLPSDCRRGNCLTCAARVVVVDDNGEKDGATTTKIQQNNGLSPAISQLVADKGYVLTCSSYVVVDEPPDGGHPRFVDRTQ